MLLTTLARSAYRGTRKGTEAARRGSEVVWDEDCDILFQEGSGNLTESSKSPT